jgi:hypothetical protein
LVLVRLRVGVRVKVWAGVRARARVRLVRLRVRVRVRVWAGVRARARVRLVRLGSATMRGHVSVRFRVRVRVP